MDTQTYNQWDQNTRMPKPPPPAHSTDCQVHVYGPLDKYPTKANAAYGPIKDARVTDLQRMHRALGFERAVLVQASIYGTDHRLILDELVGAKASNTLRGVGLVDESVSDADLARMDAAGICAGRYNIVKYLNQTPDTETIRRSIDRIRELKWHVRLHVTAQDLLDHSDFLLSIKDIPLVIDHMAHVDYAAGVNQPTMKWMLEALKRDNWWMMVSNGNRFSSMESGWDDVLPCGRAFIEAAPDRTIWATDWPHPQWTKRMMNDAEEVEDLLYRFVDGDQTLLRNILVDNPARLHGFPL